MRRLRHISASLRDDRRGLAAAEFALVLPFLLLTMLFGFQLIVYINATQKVARVANSISQFISRAVPIGGASNAKVDSVDIHFSYDSAMVLFPYLLSDSKRQNTSWWQNITINYASISFTKNTGTCSDPADQSGCYDANVVWTSTGFGKTTYRRCNVKQLPADNSEAPSNTKLPRSVFGPGSLIVIDVTFDFKPTFGSAFFPPLTIARSAYLQPRYANLIDFDATNSTGVITKC